MAKIGLPIAHNDVENPLGVTLAEDLGRARWLLVLEGDDRLELVRNGEMTGKSVADAFAEAGCTDVIVVHLGPRAFDHAREHDLKLWRGAEGVPVRELVDLYRAGALERLEGPEPVAGFSEAGCCPEHDAAGF